MAGQYSVQVTATNLAGRTSLAASTTVNLVATDLALVNVYPDPWRADQHSGHDLTFGEIPLGSTVKIFTVSGRWVQTIAESGSGKATWDLKNADGEKVQSGLYLYLVTDPQGDQSRGKFAIIR